MNLTVTKIRNLKPREKPYKLYDGDNLYILVMPNGSMYWRYRYYINGKEKILALGVCSEVGLALARERKNEAKKLLADGKDPSFVKQVKSREKKASSQNSFEVIAREWHLKNISKWTQGHAKTILTRLEKNIFPWLGNKPISEITSNELLITIQKVENRGANETAHRILQSCGQIFKYAIITCRAETDPTYALKGALTPVIKRHLASITDPENIGKLLQAIHSYEGFFVTKCALQLAPLVFVRPGELRKAEWSEISFESAEWRIPPSKMKMRSLHIVPLSKQSLSILEELHPLTGEGKYLFPGIRTPNRPMSENTITGALRRLGYTSDEMTAHGFRSMACTLLNEQGWNRDAIERQLAHAERSKVRAAYNYAEYLPERREMMQSWSDYLENLLLGKQIF